MVKQCARCRERKPIEEFPVRSVESGPRQSWCRDCLRAYRAEHYQQYREAYLRKNHAHSARLRELVRADLSSHPCVDCGESDPVVLQFDHVRGTEVGHISDMIRQGVSVGRLLVEIGKRQVRRANCHSRAEAHRRLGCPVGIEPTFSRSTAGRDNRYATDTKPADYRQA